MGRVIEVNGPLVTVELPGVRNGEQVRIGTLGLIGEVIHLRQHNALVQVYESTESLHPGEHVEGLDRPLSVELGPGLLGQIFDGVQRPLQRLLEASGEQIGRGVDLPALDRERLWSFTPAPELQPGSSLEPGAILGSVEETATITHQILVPPNIKGELLEPVESGSYRITDTIARLRGPRGEEIPLRMAHYWPVRQPRPYRERDDAQQPLLTGQRILDTFFPLVKGGKAAVPGPFGAGKTMVQQQIARWANADIILYVGCGERGNELVDILESFPQLTDPHSGRSLMERTLLVANTSNMPVVAREASIYVGVTMAEYYRDQGYDVVMVADSTSRWAEALREVAGRLGQMPVEEGYPAYLASRLAAFYERAGAVHTLGERQGSVTLIGAVSPPGGDFSEPVTSHTKEIIRTFWALSKPLADARHYPAISWVESFSGYDDEANGWWSQQISEEWNGQRMAALTVLTQADELERIVNLVGPEALSSAQRWVLESAAMIQEGLLQQSALDPVDSYCSPERQYALLVLMMRFHQAGVDLINMGMPVEQLIALPENGAIRRLKSTAGNQQLNQIEQFTDHLWHHLDQIRAEYAAAGEPS